MASFRKRRPFDFLKDRQFYDFGHVFRAVRKRICGKDCALTITIKIGENDEYEIKFYGKAIDYSLPGFYDGDLLSAGRRPRPF
jgi:hypothetical protein